MTAKLISTYLLILFTALLLNGCNGSSSTTTTTTPTTPTGGANVSLSGVLTYDFVSASTGRLNYSGVTAKPIRNVYMEVVNATSNAIIASTTTNDSGEYSLSVPSNLSFKYRIYAEMKSPVVVIQDNTNSSAEYVLVTSAYTLTADTVKDIRATSGWSGTNSAGSYTGTRAAAPFAILDSIYTISKKILTARPALSFPALKVNWSVNNINVSGDVAAGQIGTSYYNSTTKQLYILGQADVDSDEFDNHVIVHEWGHFFEDNLSRSDSGGGVHSQGDKKELSLAMGEGWGNAISAMAFDPDVYYSDTYGSKQQSGFRINLESSTDTNKGWFSEVSVQEILYDLYDASNETGDNITLGIGPIVDVFINYQKSTPATTSIISFIYGLKTSYPSLATDIDTLLATKSIASVTDPYGSTETNDGGWDKNLPIFNSITLGGAAVPVYMYGKSVAGNSSLDNSLFNNKYLRFTATSATTRLVITTTDSFSIYVTKKGAGSGYAQNIRTSASTIGPFTYDIPTTAGQEYMVNLWTGGDTADYTSAIVNLTVTGTAR